MRVAMQRTKHGELPQEGPVALSANTKCVDPWQELGCCSGTSVVLHKATYSVLVEERAVSDQHEMWNACSHTHEKLDTCMS